MSYSIELKRREATGKLDPSAKQALGQFLTPYPIATFMASMFDVRDNVVLLDGGAGIGSLTLACCESMRVESIDAWEIDPVMLSYLRDNLEATGAVNSLHDVDFIYDSVQRIKSAEFASFTHAILNPPYKKISQSSGYRLACREVGVESVNLYTCFVALAILQLKQGGEVVFIVPRSFCNGAYYRPFREFLLRECSIDKVHLFESRSQAFKDDGVLQENVIMKVTRGKCQGSVQISRSFDGSFSNVTRYVASFESVVQPDDREQYIRLPSADNFDSEQLFDKSLAELGIQASTGPVVDFRVREHWLEEPKENSAPLLYPHHFDRSGLHYPLTTKKPNALIRGPEVDKWLMKAGHYVLIKRFSSKEEKRRVVAYLVGPEMLPAEYYGFENHWNVLHASKSGLDPDLANGLICFLNSTILDDHFRVYSGHTQVNATDLKSMKFPNANRLKKLGRSYRPGMTQEAIDSLVDAV